MSDPKPKNLSRKDSLYKVLNQYLDKKIQHDKDKIIEKYFAVDSQQNLLKKFTSKNASLIFPPKK
jgi:hypothetical protein